MSDVKISDKAPVLEGRAITRDYLVGAASLAARRWSGR